MILRALLLAATGGTLLHAGRNEQFTAFASDSREVALGDLFVAVQGVHADGHDFLAAAVANGAGGLLLEADRSATLDLDLVRTLGVTTIVVPDVRMALRDYASAVLRTWHPRVLAVAGSAGKTTTKEAIATILSQHASTFASWRNYNDLLGVPLALGRLEPHHEFAVIELGCDLPGEIAQLAAITRPAMAVLLNTHAAHLDGLGDATGVAQALAALPESMGPGQVVILNRADRHLAALGAQMQQRVDAPQVVWFDAAPVRQGEPAAQTPLWLTAPPQDVAGTLVLHIARSGQAVPPPLAFQGLHGHHWSDAVLAALTVAQLLGIASDAAAQSLETFMPLPGRMRFLEGVGGMRLIDDSHNALLPATIAALTELGAWGRHWQQPRIAVLGDLLHLGAQELAAHHEIGARLGTSDLTDWLVTRGSRAEDIARAARDAGMDAARIVVTHTATDAATAVREIAAAAQRPPLVLIKGSPEMRMETVTAELLAHPATAAQVLDRQRYIWRREIVGELARPTWLEIDLDAIGANTRAIKQHVGAQVAVMATLKADAYGHGALKVAHTVLRNGATWLGVATISEAVPLRAAGIAAPILVFGYLPPWQARQAVELDVRATVYALDTAHALARAAQALGRPAYVHVKVDTGMGRLGLRAEHPALVAAFLDELAHLPGLIVEGIYTHFATADESDLTIAHEQLRRFTAVLAALPVRPAIVHAANSAATLALPESHFDLVRPGIALYGLHPSVAVPLPQEFRPALSFKTQIALVKEVPAGEGISYGHTYVTTEPERLATLPVGYADGFRRGPANWGGVLIRGQWAPIRGRVCMDQTIVSVQHIPAARAGDEVVLIGHQGTMHLSAEQVAAQLGTSNYEVVSALLARVPRVTA